jgi:peptidoglycan/xylan/chitin deacetylase (PgdA/CDA1 family)
VQLVIPDFFKLLYPKIIKSFPKAKGKLFFTFDDGPNPSVTPFILDILEKYNAKATFFCTGENVEKHPEIYMMIKNGGHATGNHTYSHINGFKCSKNKYIEDVDRASLYIHSEIFRPPYGKLLPSQYVALAKVFKIVFWDVIAFDYNVNLKPEDCVKIVLNKTKDGSIIVFHDNNKAKERVLNALPIVLEHFKNLGFTFDCIKFESVI